MTTRTYYYCDRCATDITRTARVTLPRPHMHQVPLSLELHDDEMDLCTECAQAFTRWLKQEVVA